MLVTVPNTRFFKITFVKSICYKLDSQQKAHFMVQAICSLPPEGLHLRRCSHRGSQQVDVCVALALRRLSMSDIEFAHMVFLQFGPLTDFSSLRSTPARQQQSALLRATVDTRVRARAKQQRNEMRRKAASVNSRSCRRRR